MQMRISLCLCVSAHRPAVIPIRAEKRKQLTILLAREQRKEIETFDSRQQNEQRHQVNFSPSPVQSLWARSDNAASGISGGVSLGNLI